MGKINYKVCRDNVFVGSVVKTSNVYRYEGEDNFFRTQPGQLSTGSWFSFRSMLFTPNEQKLSNDLLYRSSNYPVLNVTDDETCLNIAADTILIKDACNLAQLLEYFGYDKDLTFEDIVAIRKRFFTGKFAMDNCDLFGWKETKPEDWTYHENGQEVTDPKRLKKLIEQERASQAAGHRSFTGVSEAVLPREYWDVLDSMGNKSLDDVLFDRVHGITTHIDAFKPHKEEGMVKKLSRF